MKRKFVITLILICSILITVDNVYAVKQANKPKVNKEYIKIEQKQKAVVRYYDVNKINILPKEKQNTFYVLKQDKTRFTKQDLEKMLISQEEILLPENKEIEIKSFQGKEVVGYNIFQNRQKEYKTYQIGITNLNVNKNIKVESNFDKVYIDIFCLSTKKVYVRHINASSFYDVQSEHVIGFGEKEIVLSKKIEKKEPTADLYDNKSQNKEDNIKSLESETIYQEEYTVPVDKNIEILNILDETKKYIGYKKIVSSDRTSLENAKKSIYDGSVLRLGNIDNRVFTEEGYEDTYVDMFYVDNPKKQLETKLVGEAIGIKTIPEGKVSVKPVSELLNKEEVTELKIPSAEEIKLGVINVKPYIVPDIAYNVDTKTDRETNGKNYFDVTYRYGKLNNINIFTIKNNVKVADKA